MTFLQFGNVAFLAGVDCVLASQIRAPNTKQWGVLVAAGTESGVQAHVAIDGGPMEGEILPVVAELVVSVIATTKKAVGLTQEVGARGSNKAVIDGHKGAFVLEACLAAIFTG